MSLSNSVEKISGLLIVGGVEGAAIIESSVLVIVVTANFSSVEL